jgi:hypothetical protein
MSIRSRLERLERNLASSGNRCPECGRDTLGPPVAGREITSEEFALLPLAEKARVMYGLRGGAPRPGSRVCSRCKYVVPPSVAS